MLQKKIIDNINSDFFLLKKFETRLLKEGKQTKSKKILFHIFNDLKKTESQPFTLFKTAIINVKPFFIIKTIKKGKQQTLLPIPITSENKRTSLAIKWIIQNAQKHQESIFYKKIVKELKDAALNKGFSKQKQQEIHTIVLSNQKQIQSPTKQTIDFK